MSAKIAKKIVYDSLNENKYDIRLLALQPAISLNDAHIVNFTVVPLLKNQGTKHYRTAGVIRATPVIYSFKAARSQSR